MVANLVKSMVELLADDPTLDSATLLGNLWKLDPDLEMNAQELREALTAVAKSEAKQGSADEQPCALAAHCSAHCNVDLCSAR